MHSILPCQTFSAKRNWFDDPLTPDGFQIKQCNVQLDLEILRPCKKAQAKKKNEH